MNELMSGFLLDENNKLTKQRVVEKNSKKKVEKPKEEDVARENSIDRLAKLSRKVGIVNRTFRSSEYRMELSKTTRERNKELLKSAELGMKVNKKSIDEVAELELDSTEDTRVNRYHCKSENNQGFIKRMLPEFMMVKKNL